MGEALLIQDNLGLGLVVSRPGGLGGGGRVAWVWDTWGQADPRVHRTLAMLRVREGVTGSSVLDMVHCPKPYSTDRETEAQ